MKSPGHFIFISACLIIFAGHLISQTNSAVKGQTLNYIESSSGLSNPAWEGGKTELEFTDINQDGYIDIITIGDHGSPLINSGEHGIMVYFGDGAGNWNVQMNGDFGYGGIAAGDVNNDGFMDVGYAMHHNYSSTDFGDQLIEVALGDGTGTNWTPWDDGLAINGEDYGMFATDFADVDNDGDLDLGSISFGCCSGVHVYLNNSDGTWTQSFGVLGGNSDMIFQFGDILNDGYMDFIVGYEFATVYCQTISGDFIPADLDLPTGISGPSLGDVNNDGAMELAFVNSTGGLDVYFFNAVEGGWDDLSGNLPTTGTYENTQLVDMDMDGFIDLAAFGTGTFQLFLSDGNGNWTADATFNTGDPGSSQAFRVGGDVDHNGRPDIVLVEEEEISWFTYQNYLKCYRESSVATQLAIQPVYPRGWEMFRPNSVRFIDWISAVPGNEPATVKLEYSTIGSNGPMTLIAEGLPNTGRYQWIVPEENSVTCYIRYTITTGSSSASCVTPVAFMILNGTIGVDERKQEGSGLYVYPNPSSRQLTVDSRQSAVGGQRSAVRGKPFTVNCQPSTVNLTIADLYGREVMKIEKVPSFPYHVDISGLKDGMYVLRLMSDKGESASMKFMKIAR
jgi:hypothetical protein